MDDIDGNVRPLASSFVGCPRLREEQSQPDCDGRFVTRQGHRHEHLAIRLLAQSPAILMRYSHRQLALLGDRRVVDDEVGIVAADEGISFCGEHILDRPRVPLRGGDEVVNLLEVVGCNASGHRLDTLAIARRQQST